MPKRKPDGARRRGNAVKRTAPSTARRRGYWLAGLAALGVAGGGLLWTSSAQRADATEITVYKTPTCGCCAKWVDHLEDNGFDVTTKNRSDLSSVKETHGVASKLASCHTAVVDGYVVEGHVPAKDIRRLLRERPDVVGLAVPGMPAGSPGMEGGRKTPYEVMTFDRRGRTAVYASR